MSKISSILKNAKDCLQKAFIPTYSLDAEILLSYVLEKDKIFLFLNPNFIVAHQLKLEFEKLLKRRLKHEPIAYIIGKKEFWGLCFIVNKYTLIPRPDSETLIELALKLFTSKEEVIEILDIGTGTGCIAISLLTEFQNSKAMAIDINNKTLQIAKRNREKHHVTKRLKLIRSNLFEKVPKDKRFDIIISNPPYIPTNTNLDNNVVNFEPYTALFAEEDGLYFYKQIAASTNQFLKPNGVVILEIGIGQTKKVSDIFKNQGLKLIAIQKDLSGIDRAIAFKKK